MSGCRLIFPSLTMAVFMASSALFAAEKTEPTEVEQALYDEVYSIGKLSGIRPHHIRRLVSLLEDVETPQNVRQECLCSISKIGVAAKDAIPSLLKCLKESDPNMRSWALKALQSMGAEAKDVLGDVVNCLRDTDKTTCRQAILAVKAIDGKNATARTELQKIATDPTRDQYTKKLAAEASVDSESK